MKNILVLLAVFLISFQGWSQKVNDFKLRDVVTGNDFSLVQNKSATAIVLIFSTNTCPFSQLYKQRIKDLANKFGPQNFRFALVNPHAGSMEGESTAEMISNAKTDMPNIPYLEDVGQKLTQALGITKIPESVVITNGPTGFEIVYQGAIDNNPQLPQMVTHKYLEDALQNILEKENLSPASTRPVGCNVRAIN